jgi:hypothetical protein
MKAFVIISLLFISFVGFSQNSNIPLAIKSAFTRAFKNVSDVKWEKEGRSYEVSFVQNGIKTSADIDEKGKVLEIESEMKITSLLPQIVSYIKAHYKGKELTGASKIKYADGSINYEALIKGNGIVFDSKGSFLKVIKD